MIDVNNTKYHLIKGEADWLRYSGVDDFDGEKFIWKAGKKALCLHDEPFIFPPIPGETAIELNQRRGAAADQFGMVYWVGEDRKTIFTHQIGQANSKVRKFWQPSMAKPRPCDPGDFTPQPPLTEPDWQLGSLAITTEHFLIAGIISEPGLLIFDLYANGAPIHMSWQRPEPFIPFDIAAAPDGGFTVLSRAMPGEPFTVAYVWFFDAQFRLRDPEPRSNTSVRDDFQPVTGAKREFDVSASAQGVAMYRNAAQTPAINAIALCHITTDAWLVLESSASGSFIYYYYKDKQKGDPFKLDDPFNIRAHVFTFLPDSDADTPGAGRVFVVDSGGNQAFAFTLTSDPTSWELRLQEDRYHPIQLYSGKALITVLGVVYYDSGDNWRNLKSQYRPRFERKAEITLEPMNSHIFDCTWHRLLLEGCIPAETSVRIETRAANVEQQLDYLPWHKEPDLYLRHTGNEFPFQKSTPNKHTGSGTWELLFQAAKGQFLQIRVILEGNGRRTPQLEQVRCYYPRFSYLQEYLPAVYRHDSHSASFLDRFLSNSEGFFTMWEGAIANAQLLFDSSTIAADYLDWLGGWFGIAFEHHWEEKRKRLFIRNAITLFNQRGTKLGLLNALILALDDGPEEHLLLNPEDIACQDSGQCHDFGFNQTNFRIVENFLFRSAPGVVFGQTEASSGPGVTTEYIPWEPGQGREVIDKRYRTFLQQKYSAGSPDWRLKLNKAWGRDEGDSSVINFPAVQPSNSIEAGDWLIFVTQHIGFKYEPIQSGDKADLQAYRHFLARSYRRTERLNAAWNCSEPVKAFDEINFPDDLPENRIALNDWIQFVSLYIPARRLAHFFTVMVPVTIDESADVQFQRAAQARRIIELEKPAQTQYEVTFYWAAFRLGSARIGMDTRLDYGSRFTALQLGSVKLAQGLLQANEPPWNIENRMVLGRDRM